MGSDCRTSASEGKALYDHRMGAVLTSLAWVVAIGLALTTLDVLIGARRIRPLSTLPSIPTQLKASVVVAARNEARGIAPAMRSLLALEYPDLEIIVVNDRSTDETGRILAQIQAEHPRLRVVTVTSLPDGWLGKNHALAAGASVARGDVLLFTDADVVFEPTSLARAVAYLDSEDLDHLTALPDVTVRGVALTALVTTFGVLFGIYSRPWKARDPKSRHHIGVGAFNLLRMSAYQHIGTHAAIALRPDDDLRLAREVKRAGLRTDVVHGRDMVAVEWYTSVTEMIDGLMKNAFAGLNYSVLQLVGSTLALVAFNLWPCVGIVAASGAAQRLAGVSTLLLATLVLAHTRAARTSPGYVLLHPFGVLVFIYILWRSAILALSRGAIIWRDTSYPLTRLRASQPAPRLR